MVLTIQILLIQRKGGDHVNVVIYLQKRRGRCGHIVTHVLFYMFVSIIEGFSTILVI